MMLSHFVAIPDRMLLAQAFAQLAHRMWKTQPSIKSTLQSIKSTLQGLCPCTRRGAQQGWNERTLRKRTVGNQSEIPGDACAGLRRPVRPSFLRRLRFERRTRNNDTWHEANKQTKSPTHLPCYLAFRAAMAGDPASLATAEPDEKPVKSRISFTFTPTHPTDPGRLHIILIMAPKKRARPTDTPGVNERF